LTVVEVLIVAPEEADDGALTEEIVRSGNLLAASA
jgi:hypothetical protein